MLSQHAHPLHVRSLKAVSTSLGQELGREAYPVATNLLTGHSQQRNLQCNPIINIFLEIPMQSCLSNALYG